MKLVKNVEVSIYFFPIELLQIDEWNVQNFREKLTKVEFKESNWTLSWFENHYCQNHLVEISNLVNVKKLRRIWILEN